MLQRVSSVEIDRELVRRGGLSAFVKLAWHQIEPGVYRHNWHIDLICKKLEMFYKGEILKLLIMVPPGSMKTLLASVFGPVYAWIQDPSLKFITTTFDAKLVLKSARKHRDLVQSEWFKKRWPHVSIPHQNTHASVFFENTRKGFRFSSSIGGNVTGSHANVLMGDDLNKAQDAMGNAGIDLTGLDNAWDFWSTVLPTRQVDPATTRSLLIGQRLHEMDVPGRWLAKHKDIVVVCLPMRYSSAHEYVCAEDPRKEGELLWPEHMPEKKVAELERTLGPIAAAAQLQQSPSPLGGAVFRRDWTRNLWTLLPEQCQFLSSWDMTFGTVGASNSWVVGQVWAYKGASRYLVSQVRAQVEYPEMRQMVIDLANNWPQCRVHLIEEKAAGLPIMQDLKGVVSGMVGVRVSSSTGGKLARAQSVTGQWEAGDVYLPTNGKAKLNGVFLDTKWVDGFIDRLCRFKGVKSDEADEVDAMTQALSYIEDKSKNVSWVEAVKNLK